MNFNYSYEKKKFEQEWAKLEKEYREAGMSDKDIQTMKEFDMEYFRLNRNTVLHTCDLQDNEDLEDNGNDDFGKEIRTANGRQFEVTVTNQGFDIANNITIDFLKDTDSDEIIDSTTATLSPNESTAVTFEIDNSYLDTTESLNARSFYISAQTSAFESDYGNNSEIVNVYPDYKVTVTSDNGGTVNGSGTFPYESTTTITAVPDEGYKFFAWYENGNILYNTPETYEIKVADLNGDGYVNAKDFAMFNRFKGKSKNDIYTNI